MTRREIRSIYPWAVSDGVPLTWLAQFITKIKVVSDGDACWEWDAGRNKRYGYGIYCTFNYRGGWQGFTTTRAHILSYYFAYGPFVGPCVLHRCDNRPCVRPDHLFDGTLWDNSRDMVKKGRSLKGELNSSSKFTEMQVRVVKALSRRGCTQMDLARTFGVAHYAVQQIISGVTWKHVQ